MKKIILLILIITCITGCNTKKSLTSIDQIIAKNYYIIVDVRTKEEYKESHIKGAINIPYDQIDENTKLDKKKDILVYCKSGARSNKAYNTLKELGYKVTDLGAYDTIKLEKE